MSGRLLVVGARQGSLGEAVVMVAEEKGFLVQTAGMTQDHDQYWDVTALPDSELYPWLEEHKFTDVVCTVGINRPSATIGGAWLPSDLENAFRTNCVGPLSVLDAWLTASEEVGFRLSRVTNAFVAISSNSAHVARSSSLDYCASKAALSMAIRCAARDLAKHDYAPSIYAYEPGWIDGTPMSLGVQRRIGDVEPHRIPSGHGLSRFNLATMIVDNLVTGSSMLNGCTLRVDGGEQ